MTPSDLTAARKTLGLSREQLANHIGRSKSLVDKWEAGAKEIDPTAIRYIAALITTGWRPDDWPK